MPIFGSYSNNGMGPHDKWEADFIVRDKDVIEFRRYGTAEDPAGKLVGASNLQKGWTIVDMAARIGASK